MTPFRPGTRPATALIVDIAGTVGLRMQLGDAAAGRQIQRLLEDIIQTALRRGGEFIKSYGDDVLAVFEHNGPCAAAEVAIAAQRLAAETGLQLYAGFHSGEIEFRETMGHPDALGLTINFAARLHKLTEGVPGRILIAEESVQALPPDLQAVCARYGPRDLKGIGPVEIWTLEWRGVANSPGTELRETSSDVLEAANLCLRRGAVELELSPALGPCQIGRGADCGLRVHDAALKVSSTHLQIEHSGGCWFVHDVSRNGTWLRNAASGEESRLPSCVRVPLPRSGSLSLGRRFADDAEGRYTVAFEMRPG